RRRRGGCARLERPRFGRALRRPPGGHALVDRLPALLGRPARGGLADPAAKPPLRRPPAPWGGDRPAVDTTDNLDPHGLRHPSPAIRHPPSAEPVARPGGGGREARN